MEYEVDINQIKHQMLLKGYSLNRLAKESNISKSTISRLLNKIGSPRPETIYKIAVALNLTIEEIINEEGIK